MMEEAETMLPEQPNHVDVTYCLLCNTSILNQNGHLLDSAKLDTLIKVEGFEGLIQNQEIFETAETNLNYELTRFVQIQFTIDSQRNNDFTFCKPCTQQLINLKELQAKLVLLQKEYQKLKEVIAAGFNKTYLSRKANTVQEQELRQDLKTELSSLKKDNNPIPMNETALELQYESQISSSMSNDTDYSDPSAASGFHSINREITAKKSVQCNDASTSETSEESTKNIFPQLTPCSIRLEKIKIDPAIPRPKKKRNTGVTRGGPFKCQTCSKVFNRKYRLTLHQRIHTGFKPYECKYCQKRFCKGPNLIQHLLTHTKIKKHCCDLCGTLFAVNSALKYHLASIHGVIDNPINCSFCSEKFIWPAQLKKHVVQVHELGQLLLSEGKKGRPKENKKRKNSKKQATTKQVKPKGIKACSSKLKSSVRAKFECDGCPDLKFTSQQLLQEHHISSHIGPDLLTCSKCKGTFVMQNTYEHHYKSCSNCGVCGMEFDSIKTFKAHAIEHRTRSHQCEVCGQAFFDQTAMINHKRVKHDGERRFHCTECDQRFTTKTCLKLHMVQHTGLKIQSCDYCDLRFNKHLRKREHQVKVHPELYLVNNTFVCTVCFNVFEKESELNQHKRVHDKFTCGVCQRIFISRSRYTVHLLVHSGEKPFKCSYCTKCFNKSNNLKEHELRHTGERPHKCDQCARGFMRKMELQAHYKKEHNFDSTYLNDS